MGLAAAAKATPVQVSPEEQRLLQCRPGDDASEDDVMLWQMQLFAVRQANPVPPNFIYSGKIIVPTRDLPMSIRRPVGLRTWLSCPTVEMFNVDEQLSLIEQEELADYEVGHTTVSGGDLLTGTTTYAITGKARKRPPLPKSAAEFYTFSQHLATFMVATNRWDRAEAELHSWHVRYVMELFTKYRAEHVLLYEADFRATRHRLQDGKWNVPDLQLFQRRLQDPLLAQVHGAGVATTTGVGSRSAVGAKPPQKDYFARPCYAQVKVGAQRCCAKWNWEVGCGACEPSRDVSQCEGGRLHICSFCNGEHRVKSCAAFKAAHPDDLVAGYNGSN